MRRRSAIGLGKMPLPVDIADPERRLALAYAPADVRATLAMLWALDERLGAIVAATREAMLGEIRLTWWRDALLALEQGPPQGEPLLGALWHAVKGHGLSPTALAELPGGWSALLDPMPLSPEAIDRHARGRGGVLFDMSARLLGDPEPDVAAAGAAWALADLASRVSDPETARCARMAGKTCLEEAGSLRWSRRLRPLAILTALARRDCAAPDSRRRQGSPGRLMQVIWSGMTGR
jgi:15-cis-phytoene synthase